MEITESSDAAAVTVKFVGIYGVSPYLSDVQTELIDKRGQVLGYENLGGGESSK